MKKHKDTDLQWKKLEVLGGVWSEKSPPHCDLSALRG